MEASALVAVGCLLLPLPPDGAARPPAASLISSPDLASLLGLRARNSSGNPDENHSPSPPSSPVTTRARHVAVIEVASPSETARDPSRIPTSQRAWRHDYELPLDGGNSLVGLAPTPQQFTAFARRCGVRRDGTVVLVDRRYDATRLWWLFQYFGPPPDGGVHLLDGGYDGWVEGGFPTTTTAQDEEGNANIADDDAGVEWWEASDPPNAGLLATLVDVRGLSRGASEDGGAHKTRLWDVRSIGEHSGAVTLEGAARPGRIPWSDRRVDWDMFRNGQHWHHSSDICSIAFIHLGATTPKDGVKHTFYCQSGVRTTQLIFGMCLAGWDIEDLRNYDGSWVEWSHKAGEDEIAVGVVDDSAGDGEL